MENLGGAFGSHLQPGGVHVTASQHLLAKTLFLILPNFLLGSSLLLVDTESLASPTWPFL